MRLIFNRIALLLILINIGSSCYSKSIAHPPSDEINRRPSKPLRPFYSIVYPDLYIIDDYRKNNISRFEGHPSLVINFFNHKESGERGFWAKHESIKQATIGNLSWDKYIYNHQDVSFMMRTILLQGNTVENLSVWISGQLVN